MATPVEPEPLKGPLRFGPYTLVRRIGAGGMGEVFLAREEGVHRAVVVKKVLPGLLENKQFVGRFRDEARVVVRLAHPNIARVYAMGEVDGQLFLAMEYVQGKTLSRLAYRLRQRQRMMPLGTLLQLGQRLCEGLQYAHDATDEGGHPLHLVHRDLSPANVCVSYAGEVKIIDFGAAQSTLKEQQTAPRVVIGNLTYMAPEQARKRTVDRRADVYAAGVVLWELFAWKPLSQRGDPLERWRRAAYPQWEPAGRHRADLPRAVDAFLVRALAAEPNDRFPSAAAMGEALAALKEKLTPGVTDQDLVRLMSAAFPREKVVEQQMVDELLREQPERASTRQEFPSLRAPHVKGQAPEDAEALRAQEDIATEALDAAKLRQAAGEVTEEPGSRKAPPVRLHNQEVTKDAWVPVAGGEESTAPQRPSLGAWTPGSGGEDATAHGVLPVPGEGTSTEAAHAQGADTAGTSRTSDGSARLEGMGTQTTPGASVGSARSGDAGMELMQGTSVGTVRSDGAGEATPQEDTVLPQAASGPGAEDTTDPGEDSHPDGQAPAGPPPHPDWNPRPDAEDSAPHPRAFHREGPPPAPEDSPMQNRPSRPGWTPGAGSEDSTTNERPARKSEEAVPVSRAPAKGGPVAPSGWTPGSGDDDATEAGEPSPLALNPPSDEDEDDERTDVDKPKRPRANPPPERRAPAPQARSPSTSVAAAPQARPVPPPAARPPAADLPDATRPLGEDELPLPWTPGAAGEATEALEAAKIFGALSQATGSMPAYLSEKSTPYVPPPEAPRRQAPVVDERPTDTRPIPVRTKTRDTLVGYDKDISAALKAAEVKARERELADAKRKNPKQPAKAASLWPVPPRYRLWLMLAVVALACGLGFGAMWILLGADGA